MTWSSSSPQPSASFAFPVVSVYCVQQKVHRNPPTLFEDILSKIFYVHREPIYLQRVRDPTMMWLFDPERLTEDNNNGVSPAPAGQVTIVLNPGEGCLSYASIHHPIGHAFVVCR